jgi:capsular exopolysaccharide synthesis family protein
VSDRPNNQNQEPKNTPDEDFELPQEPEQIWPPPETPVPEPVQLSELDEAEVSQGVEKIDQAIEEIRRINGAAGKGSAKGQAATGPAQAEEIVAGKVRGEAPMSVTSVSRAAYRVRQHSDAEIGQVWGNVFYSVDQAAPRAVIVTASRRRDGATQVALALAMIGAETSHERRIALVDFNLRNPAIADVLELGSGPGLTEVLDGRLPLEGAMRGVQLPNGNVLHVLTAGAETEQPLALAKSRQAQAVITRLKERYDHTIIDVTTPNVHPDPQVVGAQVDGALLVTNAGQTPRETVAEAKRRLELAGVRCLGVVLNQRSDPIPDFLYRRT